jgi:hypothetical protein
MFIDAAFIIACSAGLIGALVVAAIGSRFSRTPWVLGCGGAFSGIALGTATYVTCRWVQHGFNPFQAWVLPVALTVLVLVMSAQDWFVFYADPKDAVQSAQPTVVVLVATGICWMVAHALGRHSLFFPVIWAGAGSLAILLCIPPIQRSIETNCSIGLGMVIGFCKIVLPMAGIILLLPVGVTRRSARASQELAGDAPLPSGWIANLLSLCWEIGLLLPMMLINGARVPPAAPPLDPLEYLLQQKGDGSVSSSMPRLKRDSVVLVLVLAIHVLCGVMIVKD